MIIIVGWQHKMKSFVTFYVSDMVVSGVPDPNGDNHAREIANMSISLVKACESFVIPHRPGELLKIRVGIHSGDYIVYLWSTSQFAKLLLENICNISNKY